MQPKQTSREGEGNSKTGSDSRKENGQERNEVYAF